MAPDPQLVSDLPQTASNVLAAITTVIDGKPEAAAMALTVMIAEGHLLIEDVPGVGKTMLAKALARSTGGSVSRIQFTPDLLPSDVTGVSVYDQGSRQFEFKPGAVFANLVIGDEINRASPKTQSALLESMEERQVSVDGRTWALPTPFMVIATQNPIEMDGTYALPEAQRDRFMATISMGYPDERAELAMLRSREQSSPIDSVQPVVDAEGIKALIQAARGVFLSSAVERYLLAIIRATRSHPSLRLGASPRSTLQLARAARARALIDGRDFVLPDDVAALAVPVLAHRILPTRESLGRGLGESQTSAEIITGVLDSIPVPRD
ncbi:AAA family ATPase [Amnibacterium flavum]|uniref:ATPase n=1 Tax=Amnibacterium flavum TaxID=2173173 RepID=A0A2V1HQW6_9MICO|nr:MoxR family ATPase [Amnibacterium flavum]PVZ95006.1 ATPase [Amnibacterium flavum]